jgi:pimeloyl-ACP methyl ester carboxylesterase
MTALGDRWRLIAPDLPGFGYSATPDPERFSYTFAGYGEFLERFAGALELSRYALYLHDYGSQHGFRLLDEIVALARDFLGRVHG